MTNRGGGLALGQFSRECFVSGIFQNWHGLTLGDEMGAAQGMQIAQLVATVCIGGIAALIAWRQWKTAQDKVKLDLFDRRVSVFMDARLLVSEALQLGKLKDPGLSNEVIARAKFLFGEDVQKELVVLHDLCTRVVMGDIRAAPEMDEWLKRFERIMRPYMSMGHLKS